MKSKIRANYSIVAALAAAEDILRPRRPWNTVNDPQAEFLQNHFGPCRDEVVRIPEIKSVASLNLAEVNRFLADNGFSEMRLDSLGNGGVYAAPILDVLLRWIKSGDVSELVAVNGNRYNAFTLEASSNMIQVFRVKVADPQDTLKELMEVFQIRIRTESGDFVNLLFDPNFNKLNTTTSFSRINVGGVLLSLLDGQMPQQLDYEEFTSVKLPMISLDQSNDISWLQGMNTVDADGQFTVIAQALQKNRLKMNEQGVRAQSTVAISCTRASRRPKELVINSPFFLWLERPGLKRPLFVAFLEYDAWKDPGSLE